MERTGPNFNSLCFTEVKDGVATKHKLCTVTDKEYFVSVPFDKFLLWRAGALIQDCFPDLTPEEREFWISGMTPDEWNQFFGEDVDD